MRFILSFAIVGSLASFSTPAFSADEQPQAEAPKEKKICRREEVLGSIIPKRTCRTAEEWKQIDNANEENAQRVLNKNRGRTASGFQG